MRRNFLGIICLLFFFGCAGKGVTKEITLSNKSKVKVYFEKIEDGERESILSVDCKTNDIKLREDEVEKEVLEIWNLIKEEAEKLELKEAVIQYNFTAGEKNKDDKLIYHRLIYNASQFENGDWKIKKAN